MSSRYVKTKYRVSGPYGSTDELTLYAHHNNSSDFVTFYDNDGSYLFTVEDTMNNNFIDAINRLYNFSDVEIMADEDKNKCNLK